MLLRLQHAETVAASLRLASRSPVFRLLRAPAAQSPHRHDSAECRDDAVLPVADARSVEDLQHGGSDVLVLHRYRGGGICQTERQHLLARWRWPLRQPVRGFRAGVAGEAAEASSGDAVS